MCREMGDFVYPRYNARIGTRFLGGSGVSTLKSFVEELDRNFPGEEVNWTFQEYPGATETPVKRENLPL